LKRGGSSAVSRGQAGQVIYLRNCCIRLVDVFETYDDARIANFKWTLTLDGISWLVFTAWCALVLYVKQTSFIYFIQTNSCTLINL